MYKKCSIVGRMDVKILIFLKKIHANFNKKKFFFLKLMKILVRFGLFPLIKLIFPLSIAPSP